MLLEAGVRAFEGALGYRDPALGAATKRSEQLFELLDANQREAAAARRRQPGMDAVKKVASAFNEQLGVYATPGAATKAAAWDAGSLAPLEPLL